MRRDDPRAGRFLTKDPFPGAAAVPGTRSRLRSWFAYVGNNPVNLVDPSGMVWEQRSTLDEVQMGLDVAGMVPLLGEPADRLNGAVYGARGRHGEAALSAWTKTQIST